MLYVRRATIATACVLMGVLAVAACGASGGGAPAAPTISSFTADKQWGDTPLATTLRWSIANPGGTKLSCSLDVKGDGKPETTIADCPAQGSYDATYAMAGGYNARLVVVDARGASVSATERIDANHIDFVKNLVQVQKLPGLVSSTPSAGSVALVFDTTEHVPSIAAGWIVWDAGLPGFVRKAASTATAGTTLTIATDTAGLEDIATGGFYGVVNVDAMFPGAPKHARAPLIQGCDPSAWPAGANAALVPFGDLDFSLVQEAHVALNDFRVAAQLSVDQAELTWAPFSLNLGVTTNAIACGTAEVDVQGGFSEDLPLPPVPGLGVQVDLGLFQAELGVVPKVSLDVTGSVGIESDFVIGASSVTQFSVSSGSSPQLTFNMDFAQRSADGRPRLQMRQPFHSAM